MPMLGSGRGIWTLGCQCYKQLPDAMRPDAVAQLSPYPGSFEPDPCPGRFLAALARRLLPALAVVTRLVGLLELVGGILSIGGVAVAVVIWREGDGPGR